MSENFNDGRSRLAYINQHRELTLGAFLGVAAFGRLILGVGVPAIILVLLFTWFMASIGLLKVYRRAAGAALNRLLVSYFLVELSIITLLVHFTGGADWVGVLFYTFPILYAYVVLPRVQARWVAWASSLLFLSVIFLEWRGIVPHHELFGPPPHWLNLPYLIATGLVGTGGGYFLVANTSSHFSRMLTSKAEALAKANRDLREATGELRVHREELERLVQLRTRDLERARDELVQANGELVRMNELKTTFLANVSHELRTPLTSIRSFSEILLAYPDEDQRTRTEFLEIIKSESERLTRLINDVLDLAKMGAGRMEWKMQTIGVEELIGTSVDIMKGHAHSRGVQLLATTDPDLPPVMADFDRMVQVLTNLLNNALKFTSRGYVRVGAVRRDDDDNVLFFVEDTGAGIPDSELHNIFEKFHQAGDALVDKPEGTGLGLPICREIVHRHGGTIWVESTLGKGSTFYFKLPAVAEDTVGSDTGETIERVVTEIELPGPTPESELPPEVKLRKL
jgi:signal transduction histidine kinase